MKNILPRSNFILNKIIHKNSYINIKRRCTNYETEAKKNTEPRSWPSFAQERLHKWNNLKEEYETTKCNNKKDSINIMLPNGVIKEGTSWQTTPLEVAQSISKGLASESIVAMVNGTQWDLQRPFEENSKLELLKFHEELNKKVFWYSSAFILGGALELYYGAHLCYPFSGEKSFYQDIFLGEKTVSSNDFDTIEDIYKDIIKEHKKIERIEATRESVLNLFDYNKHKQRVIIEELKSDRIPLYKCGPIIEISSSPLVTHSSVLKNVSVFNCGNLDWRYSFKEERIEKVHRVYGISFPSVKEHELWKRWREEAAEKDHRKIGRDQNLFFFDEASSGSCFFTPYGTYIYNELISFIRSQYRKRGFHEVITPNIYSTKLWEQSGHWEHFSHNMFSFDVEDKKYSLKPMNCPGHCIIYIKRNPSYKDLPIRIADFGVLHRNELSGALSGLTRVRRFQQDDAHIFCTPEMIKDEIKNSLKFLADVYETLGFHFQLQLATRPDNFMGDRELWNRAESQLKESLEEFGKDYKIAEGDGAFYGPKIDITVTDALERRHQCATIQLDFQLPINFNLSYNDINNESKTPVIIHRAIFGSIERMIAILAESYGGKWPLWLSPRQAIVIPVAKNFHNYTIEIANELKEANIEAEYNIDDKESLNKKIRNAQLSKFNFILVVGQKEINNGTINVRTRDKQVLGQFNISDFVYKVNKIKYDRSVNVSKFFK